MTKPSSVDAAVTPVWKSRLRGESSGQSTMERHMSSAIWCGAGSTGRCMLQVSGSSSARPQPGWSASTRSMTCGAFSQAAAAYQTTTSAPSTVSTGANRCCTPSSERRGTGFAGPLALPP